MRSRLAAVDLLAPASRLGRAFSVFRGLIEQLSSPLRLIVFRLRGRSANTGRKYGLRPSFRVASGRPCSRDNAGTIHPAALRGSERTKSRAGLRAAQSPPWHPFRTMNKASGLSRQVGVRIFAVG